MSPSDLSALYEEATALYERSELVAAALRFEQLLAADPVHVEARYKLGNVLKEQGRLVEALAQYRTLLDHAPGHAEALNNLGAVHQVLERPDAALACYQLAIDCKPGLAQPYLNLGRMLQGQGRHQDAARVYRRALEQGLDAGLFGHLLAAVDGGDSPQAPASYVRETFDAFAAGFEQRLVDTLGYRVPQQLAELVRAHGGPGARVADLGCGTGLVGAALGAARFLVGVDLSPRMLEEARRKRCYTALHEDDITAWLRGAETGCFDLVCAADVFIYIGDLERVFRDVKRLLRPGGLFAFSVEHCEGDGFRLLPTGRYAQSRTYVEGLAETCHLGLLAREPVEVRSGISGHLYLFRG